MYSMINICLVSSCNSLRGDGHVSVEECCDIHSTFPDECLSKLQDPCHCIIDLSLRNKGPYLEHTFINIQKTFTSEKMKKGDVGMAKHFSKKYENKG